MKILGIIRCLISPFLLIVRLIFQIIEFYFVIILTSIIIQANLIFITSTLYNKYLSFLSIPANLIFEYLSLNVLTIYYFELFQFSWISKNYKKILSPELLSGINNFEQINTKNENESINSSENTEIRNESINNSENEEIKNESFNNHEKEEIRNETINNREKEQIRNETINNREKEEINDIIIDINERGVNDNRPLIQNVKSLINNEIKDNGVIIILAILIIVGLYIIILVRILKESYQYKIFLLLVIFPFQKLIIVYVIFFLPYKLINRISKNYLNSIAFSLRFGVIENNKPKNLFIKYFLIIFCMLFFNIFIVQKKCSDEGIFFFLYLYFFIATFSLIQFEPWLFHKIYKEYNKCFGNANINISIYNKIKKI